MLDYHSARSQGESLPDDGAICMSKRKRQVPHAGKIVEGDNPAAAPSQALLIAHLPPPYPRTPSEPSAFGCWSPTQGTASRIVWGIEGVLVQGHIIIDPG